MDVLTIVNYPLPLHRENREFGSYCNYNWRRVCLYCYGNRTSWRFVCAFFFCFFCLHSKNIDKGRNSSCYIALCAKPVGNFTTVNDRQLFGFGNLWFHTFIKDICLEKCYSIYPVKIIQQSIQKMWKNNNIILQLNQWKLCVGYPQTVHDPSCCWQHKSCYSNILLICWSWLHWRKERGVSLCYQRI